MAIHRFAIDKMLGRLATWLRLIGQDATYGSHLSGVALVRHARMEGRTLLTRDHKLQRHAGGVPLLFIDSDHFRDQLQQVLDAFGIDPFADAFTRCVRCNAAVVPVPKETVSQRVPPYVLETQDHFAQCRECGRVYWPATHHEHVRRELERLGFSVSRSHTCDR